MELDKEGPRGEFAVYLDDEKIFSRLERGEMPDPPDIISAIRTRLSGDTAEAEHGPV